MEILSSNSSWLLDEDSRSTRWTPAENKAFENAIAVFDKNTPDRWQRVAAMVPGKTVMDVIRQYKELEDDVSSIEAGLIPLPLYKTPSPYTLEWCSLEESYVARGRKSYSSRAFEQERKKGVPWTEEEHKLFLMGLKEYGKGDWRNISRNFVITRTPTQVASHAQKYFIRQLSRVKDKKRASIHDITTLNLNDYDNVSQENQQPPTMDQTSIEDHENLSISSPYGVNLLVLTTSGRQHMQSGAMHDSYLRSQSLVFQMQPGNHYTNS